MWPHQLSKLLGKSRRQHVRINHDRALATGVWNQVPQRGVGRVIGEVFQRAHQRHAQRGFAERVDHSNHEPIEVFVVVHRLRCIEG